MTVADLLAELREIDVHVVLDGDRLRLNAPAGVLTDELKRDLAEHKSKIIAFLREAQQLAAQQRAIVPLEAAGTRTPIFAVAGHNGDVFAYRSLAQHLGPDQPFFGLQPPGLEEGSEPLTRVEDMARYFAEQIRAFRPVGPMSIAGFCAGGTIAFELARELTNSGAFITNLILFGAPYCSSYRSSQQPMVRAARYYTSRSVTHARTLLTMPAAERARFLADRARKLLPREESDPVLIRRGAVEEATLAAVRAYTPEPSGCHIDFMIPCESWKRSSDDPLRWSRLAASSTVFVGPDDCNGDIMLKPQHAATFAAFVADAQRRHALVNAVHSTTTECSMKLTDQIDRQAGLSSERFEQDYLDPLRPVIITDAQNYGELEIDVDGEAMALRDLIDRVESSTDESPAPYLRNQALAQWPPELMTDITPMPECTRRNWLESKFFPSGKKLASIKVDIGGRGATFPTLHYDGLHTHAFLMQLYGDKEYIVFSPDQTPYMYPRSAGGNTSQIENLLDPDLDAFPLVEHAEVRFELHPGETLFVPSGWWHTARILSPSVTVSINGVNRANYANFRRDYCASIAKRSRIKGFVAWAGLAVANATQLFEEYGSLVLPFV